MRKFAAFDIDGTLFRSGLYRELFYELVKMGVIPSEVAEESTMMHRKWRHRIHGNAFEEFEQVIIDYMDSSIPKLKLSDYDKAAQRVLTKKAENVYVYTRNLLKKLQDEGYFTIAISGSTIEVVEPFAERYGFDTWIGQTLERGEEYFTGNITKTHTGKDKILRRLIEEHNLTLDGSYGVGDSHGDVGMLSMVENPIAFSPTQELYAVARQRGWKIVVERKNVIYELNPTGTDGNSHILADSETA